MKGSNDLNGFHTPQAVGDTQQGERQRQIQQHRDHAAEKLFDDNRPRRELGDQQQAERIALFFAGDNSRHQCRQHHEDSQSLAPEDLLKQEISRSQHRQGTGLPLACDLLVETKQGDRVQNQGVQRTDDVRSRAGRLLGEFFGQQRQTGKTRFRQGWHEIANPQMWRTTFQRSVLT